MAATAFLSVPNHLLLSRHICASCLLHPTRLNGALLLQQLRLQCLPATSSSCGLSTLLQNEESSSLCIVVARSWTYAGHALNLATFFDASNLYFFFRGPHVLSSSIIGDVVLTSCSAVHLQQQANSSTLQCQRVSGTAAPSRSELAAMIAAKEVAKTSDHRLLGTSMGLFFFDSVSPG